VREFSTIDALIRERLQTFQLEHGVKAQQSLSLWERVAGPTVAAVTVADGIRNGVLYVLTHSSAWSQELSMLRGPLIARINAELEREVVQEIRFQVKPFVKDESSGRASQPARDLTDAERTALEHLASQLAATTAGRITEVAAKQMRRTESGRVCAACGGPVHPGETLCPFCRT
jgi:hypothetical protein